MSACPPASLPADSLNHQKADSGIPLDSIRSATALMVRETSDDGRWTLPGGWADVNRTAAQNVVKEALEERLSR